MFEIPSMIIGEAFGTTFFVVAITNYFYNKKEKCAYGSEENAFEIDFEENTEQCDSDAIENDIINRIQIIP